MVYAIIPARSGSKGIKDKNLSALGGFPLMAYSIAAAKLAGQIDRVLISTDSERYAEVGCQYGAEVPFLRPAELSGDEWEKMRGHPVEGYRLLQRIDFLREAAEIVYAHHEHFD